MLAGGKMSVNKKDIIKLLETIAIYMEIKGENPFKVSAFRKAAAALEADDRSLSAIDDFTALNGIGKGTAAVIDEFINEGKSTVSRRITGGSAERLNSVIAAARSWWQKNRQAS